jgi:hypothetical protein
MKARQVAKRLELMKELVDTEVCFFVCLFVCLCASVLSNIHWSHIANLCAQFDLHGTELYHSDSKEQNYERRRHWLGV